MQWIDTIKNNDIYVKKIYKIPISRLKKNDIRKQLTDWRYGNGS